LRSALPVILPTYLPHPEQEPQHSAEPQQEAWAALAALASPSAIIATNRIVLIFFIESFSLRKMNRIVVKPMACPSARGLAAPWKRFLNAKEIGLQERASSGVPEDLRVHRKRGGCDGLGRKERRRNDRQRKYDLRRDRSRLFREGDLQRAARETCMGTVLIFAGRLGGPARTVVTRRFGVVRRMPEAGNGKIVLARRQLGRGFGDRRGKKELRAACEAREARQPQGKGDGKGGSPDCRRGAHTYAHYTR
jgi:hypothetical protein